ncbi:MAG: hypothetical protein A2091_03545 [Desulfuromonadales bacterium GWD2_61_12]|nr:MAG: hypothetical protein A2091_03545 [Desulfuromonadales bacterium GWD2_61_12]OGR33519.1 MAG: hypothetical protein A2005_08130 [Desulfuromonadales bacterium GWC2_61_20]
MKRMLRTTLATFAAAALVLTAGQAFAAGTEAGQSISNTASVDYTIGGTPTTTPSNPTSFLVDRMINPVVVYTGAATVTVVAGATNYVLPFTIQNLSNTPLATNEYFNLTTSEVTANIMQNVEIYRDVNGDGLLDGGDTLVLAPVLLVRDAAPLEYLIVADVLAAGGAPDTATPGLTAPYDLVATAWAGALVGDGALAADGDGNDAAASEIVFADAQGTASVEVAAPDGIHSARGTYITAATLGVAKSVSNGVSGYQIPGDVVTYTIAVTNSDSVNAATAVTISDAIPGFTLYSLGTLTCTGAGFTAEYDHGAGFSTTEAPANTVTAVRCSGGSIAASGNASMAFGAAIQ